MAFGQTPVQGYSDKLIRLLDDKKIRLDDIITHRSPLSDAPPRVTKFLARKKTGASMSSSNRSIFVNATARRRIATSRLDLIFRAKFLSPTKFTSFTRDHRR